MGKDAGRNESEPKGFKSCSPAFISPELKENKLEIEINKRIKPSVSPVSTISPIVKKTVGVVLIGILFSSVYFISRLSDSDRDSRQTLLSTSDYKPTLSVNPVEITTPAIIISGEDRQSQKVTLYAAETTTRDTPLSLVENDLPGKDHRRQGKFLPGDSNLHFPMTDGSWQPKHAPEPGKYVLGSFDDYPPALREEAQLAFDQMKSQGYISSTEEEVSNELTYLKNYYNYSFPMSYVEEKLSFNLDDLQGTPFDKYNIEGFIPGGDPNGKSESAARFFTDSKDGLIVKLDEWAYPFGSGGGVVMLEEGATKDVNGYPATLTIMRSPDGQAISGLVWLTSKKMYTLSMPGDVKKEGRYEEMLSLARSVPGSQKKSSAASR